MEAKPKRARSMSLGIALIGAITTAMLIGAASPAVPPPPVTESSPVNLIADQFNTTAVQDFSSSYAGIQIVDANDVTIYTVGQAAGLISAASAVLGDQIHITFTPARSTLASLRHLAQEVSQDATLPADGTPIVETAPDVTANSVDVTFQTPSGSAADDLPDYLAKGRAALARGCGGDPLTVEDGTLPIGHPINCPYGACRYNDSPPFWGGDQILVEPTGGSNYEECSTGFAVLDPQGYESLITAAHCDSTAQGYTGASVYISLHNGAQTSTYIGKVQYAYQNSGGISNTWPADFSLIRIAAGSNAYVWGGAANSMSPPFYPVTGDIEPANGSGMTVDGAYSGEYQSLTVRNNWTCIDYGFNNASTCGVGIISEGSGNTCAGGDSGGPAYVHEGGGVYAAGTLVGNNSAGYCYFEEIDYEIEVADWISGAPLQLLMI